MTPTREPTYAAVKADRGFDPARLTDFGDKAIRDRATAKDAERGRAIVQEEGR